MINLSWLLFWWYQAAQKTILPKKLATWKWTVFKRSLCFSITITITAIELWASKKYTNKLTQIICSRFYSFHMIEMGYAKTGGIKILGHVCQCVCGTLINQVPRCPTPIILSNAIREMRFSPFIFLYQQRSMRRWSSTRVTRSSSAGTLSGPGSPPCSRWCGSTASGDGDMV